MLLGGGGAKFELEIQKISQFFDTFKVGKEQLGLVIAKTISGPSAAASTMVRGPSAAARTGCRGPGAAATSPCGMQQLRASRSDVRDVYYSGFGVGQKWSILISIVFLCL